MQSTECCTQFHLPGTSLKYCRCDQEGADKDLGQERSRRRGTSLSRVTGTPSPQNCLDNSCSTRRKVVKFQHPQEREPRGYSRPKTASADHGEKQVDQPPNQGLSEAALYGTASGYHTMAQAALPTARSSNDIAGQPGVARAPVGTSYPREPTSQARELDSPESAVELCRYTRLGSWDRGRQDQHPSLGILQRAEERLRSVSRFRLSEFEREWRARRTAESSMKYDNAYDGVGPRTALRPESYSMLFASETSPSSRPLFEPSHKSCADRTCFLADLGYDQPVADVTTTTTGDDSTASAISADSSCSVQSPDTVQPDLSGGQLLPDHQEHRALQPVRIRRAEQERRVELLVAEVSREVALLQQRETSLCFKAAPAIASYKRSQARTQLSFN